MMHFMRSLDIDLNISVVLVARFLRVPLCHILVADTNVVRYPALSHSGHVFHGASSSFLHLMESSGSFSPDEIILMYDLLELSDRISFVDQNSLLIDLNHLQARLNEILLSGNRNPDFAFLSKAILYSTLVKTFRQVLGTAVVGMDPKGSFKVDSIGADLSAKLPLLINCIAEVQQSIFFSEAIGELSTDTVPVLGSEGDVKVETLDWATVGLLSSLKTIFTQAMNAAFPGGSVREAIITRCGNAAHGDFQCNNALGLAKEFKDPATSGGTYSGPKSPKGIADTIILAMRKNPLIAEATSAPNGFINIRLSDMTLVTSLVDVVKFGVRPPALPKKKVLVDFSSPNIAKEMHVGHLRSTIIGDAVCRVLEFCGHDVMRVNHVGDWGTQFGMLISYLQEEYPDILTQPPNISDLTSIYKASKKRFDADETFKEKSRLNVVKLQSGDPACRQIWTLLCDISRVEFQKVYDMLNVKLQEVGESFYNPFIPNVLDELSQKGMIIEEDGMLIIKLENFNIPLIVRKSDGGYGYDSTDMAAMSYRLRNIERDWVIYITDAGQAMHFHMCFVAAGQAGWVDPLVHRLDHIGFGVVCGDDGKRFKTRSSETVRLIDLLNAAKDRMEMHLRARAAEGKTPLQSDDDFAAAAAAIGYGAVKYFDLKQHPGTNYIFSYDRMLDTKGDTAVYLLFAYARLVSILRKANEERNIDIVTMATMEDVQINLSHPAERTLAFELLQFGDVIKSVLQELLLNRLCEYLYEVSTKFTDFVTKCHVLNASEEGERISRLMLCEATRRVMCSAFGLLGITTLERI